MTRGWGISTGMLFCTSLIYAENGLEAPMVLKGLV